MTSLGLCVSIEIVSVNRASYFVYRILFCFFLNCFCDQALATSTDRTERTRQHPQHLLQRARLIPRSASSSAVGVKPDFPRKRRHMRNSF